jgi:uncharacterized membrane protein YGL010W
MTREGGLMAWQWRNYDANHRDRGNLLLHFVAVPAFIGATLALVSCLLHGYWFAAALSFLLMVLAFAVQAVGHKRESEAPIPFDGAGDFLGRVFIEQFITFPRFILSGGWLRQLQHRNKP